MQGLKEMSSAKYDVMMDEESNLSWRNTPPLPISFLSLVLYCGDESSIPFGWVKYDGGPSFHFEEIELRRELPKGAEKCFFILCMDCAAIK